MVAAHVAARRLGVGRLRDHLPALLLQDAPQAGAHHRVVVGDDDPHGAQRTPRPEKLPWKPRIRRQPGGGP